MPELPEVETVRRQLSTYVVGKHIRSVEVFREKSWRGDISTILGHRVEKIERRSKVLRFVLSKGLNILVHLKMSGQLIYVDGDKRVGGGHPTADFINELPSKHTRVEITFSDGTRLFFNDQRVFGWLRMMNDDEVKTELSGLAPDVIDRQITAELLYDIYQKRSSPVKQVLMDNAIAAGVGNIYACDALNLAKISPFRPAKSLSKAEVKKLLTSAREVVELGIKLGGATVHGDYKNVEGLSGRYQEVLRVYNRAGEACPNCGHVIEKQKLAGRGTYFCPHCQK